MTHLILLLQQCPSLTVTKQCPLDRAVLQLRHTDLAGESSVGLVKNILCADFNLFTEVFTGEEEIEEGRGNDNLF